MFQSAFCHFNQRNTGKQNIALGVWAQLLINFKKKNCEAKMKLIFNL